MQKRAIARGWCARWGVACALLAAVGVGLGSARPVERAPGHRGISRPSDLRELGFALRGRIGESLVEPGDRVRAGDALISLDDVVQRLTVDLARSQAEDTSTLDAAERSLAFRERELQQVLETSERGGASEVSVREATFRRDLSRVEVSAARADAARKRIEHEREAARLDLMTLRSPIEGEVLEVRRRAGEPVDELSPVVVIVDTDPLWVDVNVPTRDAIALAAGQTATVTWEDLPDRPAVKGRIIFRSPAGSGGARVLLVRVEVPNPDGLPSGMHAVVRFDAHADSGGGPE